MTTTFNPDVFIQLKTQMPKMIAGFEALQDMVQAETELDNKTKSLTALAIAITRGSAMSSDARLASALDAGATPDEIAETIGLAMFMGGEPAALNGRTAYAALNR